jgi:hypothetical protein
MFQVPLRRRNSRPEVTSLQPIGQGEDMVVVAVLALLLAWFAAAFLVGMVIGGAARMRDRVGVPASVAERRHEGLRLLV